MAPAEIPTLDPSAVITTRRLVLHPLAVADAAEMAEVLADLDLYVFTGGEPPTLGELETRYAWQVKGSGRIGLHATGRLDDDGETIWTSASGT